MLKTTIVLIALSLFPRLVAAEPPPDGALHDRARTFLVLRLTDALGLSDEKALEVSRILKGAEERRRKLAGERDGVGGEIRDVLGSKTPDERRLQELVERAGKLDQEVALVPARSFEELRKILTIEQQAKLVLARPKIHEEVRGAMRRRMLRPPGAEREDGDGPRPEGRPER
jgi:hypothetical protein